MQFRNSSFSKLIFWQVMNEQNSKRYQEIAIIIFVIVGGIAIFLLILPALDRNFVGSQVDYYAVLLLLILLSAGPIWLLLSLIILLARATEIAKINNSVRVNYVYWGERNFPIRPHIIRKNKVWEIRLNDPKDKYHPSWLVRLGGWRFAVMPIDWEMPEGLAIAKDG
jgi:hypothetical protein